MTARRSATGARSNSLWRPVPVLVRAASCLIVMAVVALSSPATADPLRLSGVDYLGDLPTLVAEQNGFFARHGVEVEVAYAASGRDNLRRLRAGEIDFGLMATTPLVFDAIANPARGGPDDPVILANLSHVSPVIHLMMIDAGDTPPNEALRGRTVGVPRGSNAHYVLHVIATINGIGADDYTVVDMDPADMADAMASGLISASSVWEPWASRLRDRFGARLIEVPDVGHYVSRWLLVARRGAVEANPDHAIAVLKAYRDAVDWIKANDAAALALFAARASGAAPRPMRAAPDLLFDVTLDWSLIASYRHQMAWAITQTGDQGQALPSFMDMVAAAPLAAIAPQSVLIPNRLHPGDGNAP